MGHEWATKCCLDRLRELERLSRHRPPGVAKVVFERGTPLADFARPALVDGAAGPIIVPGRRPIAVVGFTIADGRIVEIDLVAHRRKPRAVAADE